MTNRELQLAVQENDDVLDICRRAAAGDASAQAKLMELLFDHIHTTASYMTRNAEEAKDVAQMACIAVLQSAGSFRGDSSLRFWADRIVLKVAANVYRKTTRRKRLWQAYAPPPSARVSTDENAERGTVRDRLTALLQEMKPQLREVMVLRHIHGYSMKETAVLCDLPLETARSRMKKSAEVLRQKVSTDPVLSDWINEWIAQ
ncbi:MAG: RNA polymerase sigma factor [Deltaproteobacteria bacterium]|nr:RNA polymerase sigma factor [Deltaproteobacteria bacterium]